MIVLRMPSREGTKDRLVLDYSRQKKRRASTHSNIGIERDAVTSIEMVTIKP